MRDELRSGLSYVRHHGSLVALIVLAAATTFLGFAVLTFLPLFTQTVFNEGAQTYSHLLAFSGAGSVVGALVVAWLGKFPRMGLTALVVQAAYGLLILAFAMSHVLWLSEVLLFLTGAALMVVFSTVTSLIQLIAPNEMRGRVMSIYMVAFRGGMPLGSLVSGYLATLIGAQTVIAINGVLAGHLVAGVGKDPRQRYVQGAADRAEQFARRLLAATLDLGQVAQAHASGVRHLAQRAALVYAGTTQHVADHLAQQCPHRALLHLGSTKATPRTAEMVPGWPPLARIRRQTVTDLRLVLGNRGSPRPRSRRR